MRKLTVLWVLAFAIAISTLPASADQLTLGTGSTLYFCAPSGGGNISVSAAGFTTPSTCTGTSAGAVMGAGYFESVNTSNNFTGTYSIGFPSGPSLELNQSPNSFYQFTPANNVTSSFSFSDAGGQGALAGTITWDFVQDHTQNPRFNGILSISSVSGSNAAFLEAFPALAGVHVDFTLNTVTRLDSLGADGGVTSNTISSGEVPGVPEVSSILLLGTGMLTAGTFIRLRRRRQS